MRVAICSNQREECEQLESYLRKYSKQKNILITVKIYENTKQFLYHWGSRETYDFIFIQDSSDGKDSQHNRYGKNTQDSQDKKADNRGNELAKLIRNCDEEIGIILMGAELERGEERAEMTAEELERVYQGYEVEALYYLRNPLREEECKSCVDLMLKRLQRQEKRYLLIEERGDIQRISHREICYIESASHHVILHTGVGEVRIRQKIGEIRERLPRVEFIDIHRSYIVNLSEIMAINDREITMFSGKKLPISKNYPQVRKVFTKWMIGG